MDNGPWSMLQRLTLRQVALLCHHCAQLLETKMGRLRWGDEDGRPKSGLCLKSLSQIFVSGLCLWRCGGMRRGRCGGDRRFLGGASSTAWRLAWEGADHCAQLRGDFWRPSTSARPPQVPPQFWTMDNGPWSMLQRLTLRQVALLCHHCAQLLETKMGRLRWGDEDGRPKSGLCLKSLSQIFVSNLCLLSLSLEVRRDAEGTMRRGQAISGGGIVNGLASRLGRCGPLRAIAG